MAFPFFKQLVLNFHWFYLLFGAFIIVGAANAVNFTDGLDGLATVPVMIAAAAYGLIAYIVGNYIYANYLQLHFVPGVGEVGVYLAAMVGAGMGFLWYNAPPAKIFMGDTGSLALGGGLGAASGARPQRAILGSRTSRRSAWSSRGRQAGGKRSQGPDAGEAGILARVRETAPLLHQTRRPD